MKEKGTHVEGILELFPMYKWVNVPNLSADDCKSDSS